MTQDADEKRIQPRAEAVTPGGTGPRGGKRRLRKTGHNKAQFDMRSPGAELEAEDAGPLVKWVGGKARIADEVIKRLPKTCERYVEPFAGGAAVFWRYRKQAKTALLADLNEPLINLYVQVQDAQNLGLTRMVQLAADKHAEVDSAAHYKDTRDKFNDRFWKHDELRAGAFVYLNKAGYNGLWRVNKAGRLNVPWGKRTLGGKKLGMPVAADYVAAWQVLRGVELRVQDFSATLASCGAGDAVYVDPPYPGTFDQYASPKFDDDTHRSLAVYAYNAAAAGAHVVISISDHPLSHGLYQPGRREVERLGHHPVAVRTRLESLSVHHQVGPTAKERGKKGELLITLTKE